MGCNTLRNKSINGNITEAEIGEYLAKRVKKKMSRSKQVSGVFVWGKKIEKQGGLFSVKEEIARHTRRLAEVENLKREREQREIQKALHVQEMELIARKCARAENSSCFEEEEEVLKKDKKSGFSTKVAAGLSSPCRVDNKEEAAIESNGLTALDEEEEQTTILQEAYIKPEYLSCVLTAYEWNKYNRTHYDYENPPPKLVKGYKFDIFYPHVFNKTKTPYYSIEKDGSSADTCILRFHAGSPYQDIAFRILNKEWNYCTKNGFRCTFDNHILRLYFNFKIFRYCR